MPKALVRNHTRQVASRSDSLWTKQIRRISTADRRVQQPRSVDVLDSILAYQTLHVNRRYVSSRYVEEDVGLLT